MKIFPPHATDFYKTGHLFQYPAGTELVYSNFTCRSDRFADVLPDFDHKAVFFGLQGVCQWLLRDLWRDNFFALPKAEVIARYARRMDAALGAGAVNTDHIGKLHDLGYLPVFIKSLPEGSRVNMRVPLWTIRNTHTEFFWVTNYLETQLSAEVWKATTSATTAYEYRRLLNQYADKTGSDLNFVPWQGHDFSFRGMSGIMDAAQSGAAHLTSFLGTDTISALDYLEDYYRGADTFLGGSVPATEHSVMCMGGCDDELETFRRLACKTYPNGIVSIVSDTWDFWRVLTEFAPKLKAEIMARQCDGLGNAKVVFRPDSGDPVKILVGDKNAPAGTPESKGAVECLWDVFGGTTTSTGHRMLDKHVGLIYGDSITIDRAQRILQGLREKGYASGNVVFGIGSFTYQRVTRDTLGTAIKATFGRVSGEDRELFKEPKTDDGIKKSARGLLRVEKEGSDFVLHDRQSHVEENRGLLRPIFCDGKIVEGSEQSIADIRKLLLGA